MRQRVLLDFVHEAARLAGGRNQVVPAPGCEVSALPPDPGHVGGQRIQAAEVVQQPAVDAVGGERRLHGPHVQSDRRL
jgi:hypothetical protein